MKWFVMICLFIINSIAYGNVRPKDTIISIYDASIEKYLDERIGEIRYRINFPKQGNWDIYLVYNAYLKKKNAREYASYKIKYFNGRITGESSYSTINRTIIFNVYHTWINREEIDIYYDSGKIKKSYVIVDSVYQDRQIEYYENGNPMKISHYEKGKFKNFKTFYKSGNIKAESWLTNEIGWVNCYENNGSLKAAIFFEDSSIKFINIYHNEILFLKYEGLFEDIKFYKIDVLNIPKLLRGSITYYDDDKAVISSQMINTE